MSLKKYLNRELLGSIAVNLMIIASWLFLLVDAFFEGSATPSLVNQADLSVVPEVIWRIAVPCTLTATAVASAISYWQRERIMQDFPVVTSLFDRFFGQGAYGRLTSRLRPVSATVVSSLLFAGAVSYENFNGPQNKLAFLISLGFAAFTLFMIIAMIASRRWPPELN